MCEEQLLRQQLQADFEYNLQLLGERDRELGQYEVAVAEMRAAINSLTAENSELKAGGGWGGVGPDLHDRPLCCACVCVCTGSAG